MHQHPTGPRRWACLFSTAALLAALPSQPALAEIAPANPRLDALTAEQIDALFEDDQPVIRTGDTVVEDGSIVNGSRVIVFSDGLALDTQTGAVIQLAQLDDGEAVEIEPFEIDQRAGDTQPEEGLTPEMRRILLQMVRENPEMRGALLEQYPELRAHLDAEQPDAAEPAPPAPDIDALLAEEAKRKQAEALIAELAKADEKRAAEIEAELAGLGEASLVPLKLAALSDDFELRVRAGSMARRLRWRLASSAALLDARPDLPAVLAGEDSQPRRALVDALLAEPQAHLVSFFVECLADRDAYLRERGIDGLVKLGEDGSRPAIIALEQAALGADDETVVLLAVAGLGEVGKVDIEVMTRLFESTDSAEVQRTILLTAGYSRQASAIDLIARALKDPRWRVRAAGLEALEDIKSNADKNKMGELVRPLLADPEPFIRATAMRLIAELELPGSDLELWKLYEAGQIDERAGLDALAQLQSAKAYAEILKRYQRTTQAGEHADAVAWLAMLAKYEERAEVDQLIRQVLGDDSRRAQWTGAIGLASRRDQSTAYLPVVAPMLLDQDPAVRSAVWNGFGQWEMRSYDLPDAVERGLAQGDTQQRLWRVNLLYSREGADPTGKLVSALSDPEPAVVNRALAMIAELKITDPLGDDELPYRGSSDDFVIDEFGNPTRRADPAKALSDELVQALTKLNEHKDVLARTRAAAILYFTGKDRGEAVVATLRAAIQSDLPMHQAITLKAATAEPGTLTQGVDLIALTRGQTYEPLLHNASAVMLASGDEKQIAEVVRIADGINIRYEEEFFLTLGATGADAAIKLIGDKLASERSYTVRSFIEQLGPLNADATVTLAERLLENTSLEGYDRQEIVRTLMQTRSDKLVPLLEREVVRLSESRDPWERQTASEMERMLLQLDPERAQKQIGTALVSGDTASQQRAIQTLLQMQATDALAELVLDAAIQRKDGAVEDWAALVGWSRSTGVFGKFERALSDLPGPMQTTMLDALAEHAGPDDLAMLLSLKPASAAARSRVTMIVAEVLAKHPEARPASFDDAEPSARAVLLDAAGQWGNGEALIRPWLDSEDPATAQAALRGLAIALLNKGADALSEDDAKRFEQATRSDDAYTAYLAVEVLYQLDRERLLALDPKPISSPAALLRLACAKYERDGGAVDLAVDESLRGKHTAQSTATRFALIATINAGQSRMYRLAAGPAQTYHGDLVARAALQFGSFQEFTQAAQMNLFKPGDEGTDALIESTLERLGGRGVDTVGMLIQSGWVERIPTDQLDAYLDSFVRWQLQYFGGSLNWDRIVPLLDREDPALRGALSQAMARDTPGSALAAMLAWQLYEDDAALQHLVDAAAGKAEGVVSRRYEADPKQLLALGFLADYGTAAQAPALLAAHAKLDRRDPWLYESLGSQLIRAATQLDADATRAYLKKQAAEQPKNDDFGRIQYSDESQPFEDLLNTMIIDAPDYAERRLAGQQANLELTQVLEAMKSGGGDGHMLAQPPWDVQANQYLSAMPDELPTTERRLVLDWVRGTVDQDQLEMYQQTIGGLREPVSIGTGMLPHDWALLGDAAWYFQSQSKLFMSPDDHMPAVFYATLGTVRTCLPLHADYAHAAEDLRGLLTGDDSAVASRAIRAAAAWRVTALRDELLAAVARGDDAGIEAAWASAMLFGPAAVQPIRARLQSSELFDERVELACLLVLLGEDETNLPILAEARRLLTVQQLRGRALTLEQPPIAASQNPRGRYIESFDGEVIHQGGFDVEPPVDGQLTGSNARWSALLLAVTDASLADALHHRLDLAPLQAPAYIEWWGAAEPTPDADGRLALQRSSAYGLVFAGAKTHGLPIRDLVGTHAPAFAHLDKREQKLFARSLTTRAGGVSDTSALESAWRDWLKQHADAEPDALWRAGVADAINDLTDTHWWRRSLARERLQRLTGRAIEPPALFGSKQWAEMQAAWRDWSASDAGASPRAALSAVAIESGLTDQAPTDPAGELAMLVRLAGWGDEVQSLAALHRLELWPDRAALLRAAAAWQAGPRPALRMWYLQRASDAPRIYVAADELN